MSDDDRWVFNEERRSIYNRLTDFEVMIVLTGHPDQKDAVLISRGDILEDGKKFLVTYDRTIYPPKLSSDPIKIIIGEGGFFREIPPKTWHQGKKIIVRSFYDIVFPNFHTHKKEFIKGQSFESRSEQDAFLNALRSGLPYLTSINSGFEIAKFTIVFDNDLVRQIESGEFIK